MRSRPAPPAPIREFKQHAALPGVGMLQLTLDGALSRSLPLHHGTAVHLEGESEWSVCGARYSTRPGTVAVKVPGELYAERARAGRSRFEVLVYDDALVDEARAQLARRVGAPRPHAFDGLRDRRVRPLMRMHRAMNDAAVPAQALAEALTEALTALVELTSLPSARAPSSTKWSDAVRRARALLDERMLETVTLDELAAHARLDKFRLCRAFREQVGVAPYAYLTHRRISFAQELLGRGVPQAEVAAQVGLYDQSQLHRHFKRIVGITPGAYAKVMVRSTTPLSS